MAPEVKFLPAGSVIPSEEIVFLPDSPVNSDYQRVWMGFIHPDGSGLETRSYEVTQSLFFIKYYYQRLGNVFTWSLDGASIGAIFPQGEINTQGNPIILHSDGSISFCDPNKSIIVSDGILVISSNEIMALQIGYSDDDQSRLVIYNMDQCRISKVLYATQKNEYVSGASYTTAHWLALGIYSNNVSEIRIYDPNMNLVSKIKNAESPAFSKDGLKIAYTTQSRNVCFSDLNSSNSNCYGAIGGGPSWSPDSKWLVYTDDNDNIIKLNLGTGEITTIGKGRNPDWRP